ncbi:hypothetical protein MCOR25_010373 [Pyricularia grisea]|nr:hypothetical protein MCOR25_010373 [Pyricularia grisea]
MSINTWLIFATLYCAVTVFSLQQYIVEVSDVQAINHVKESIVNDASCYQNAPLSFRHVYNNSIFPGFSLDINSSDGHRDPTRCLKAIAGVVKVWQSQPYAPASQSESPSVPASNGASPLVNSSILHGLTGVQALRETNVTGRGITVAVIDTGIDYLHPALGGGIGNGFKVRFGLDLVGDNFQIGLPPQGKGDSYAECTAHGTHVSGIVAGDQPSLGFVGVAPEVNLEHYRVAGCRKAPIQSDIIIQAVLKAQSREVDVISISLTLNSGPYPDDALSEVLTRISRQGEILIVVASGDYGWQGPFSARAPGSAVDVLTVGSINAAYSIQSRPRATFSLRDQKATSQSIDFPWDPASPGRFPSSLTLQATTLNMSVTNDACIGLERDGNFSDASVILVRRGGCQLDVKMKNLAARGAKYVLVYNNENKPSFQFDNNFDGIIAAGSISAQTGRNLIGALATGSAVYLNMDPNFGNMPYIEIQGNLRPAGQINGQTSWGPTGLGDTLTSLLAPGQSIWSTIPRTWGGYGTMSGTSMAAPYVAGCAALVMQVYPSLSSTQVMTLLTTTARPLNFNDGADSKAATPWTRDTVTPWTRDNASTSASEEFLQSSLEKIYADITISPTSLTIEPDIWTMVNVTANIDALNKLKPRCPLYSGFIFVDDGKIGSQLSLSYSGIGCSMREMAVIPRGWNETFVTAATTKESLDVPYDAKPIPPDTEFKLQGHKTPLQYKNSSTLLPTLKVELAMSSQAIAVHVLPAAASGENEGIAVFSHNQTVQAGGFSRLSKDFFGWSGLLENGSWAAEGVYKFKVCAFRAWEQIQDPNARKDCVVTEPFGIRY